MGLLTTIRDAFKDLDSRFRGNDGVVGGNSGEEWAGADLQVCGTKSGMTGHF